MVPWARWLTRARGRFCEISQTCERSRFCQFSASQGSQICETCEKRRPNGRQAAVQGEAGAVDVEFVPIPAVWPAGPERIEIRLDGQMVGDLDFRACALCRVAVIEQVRIDPPYRRRGLACQAVRTLLDRYPDHAWHTTAIQPEAAGFWAALGWPIATLGEPDWCAHMHAADRNLP